MNPSLLFGALWSILLLIGYLQLPRLLPKLSRYGTQAGLFFVIVTALIVRLVPNIVLPNGAVYDIESYHIVGELVLNGEDVYTNPEAEQRYPYLPLQMYWSAFSVWSADTFQLPFVKIVRLAPILADVGIAALLFVSLLRSSSSQAALLGGISYAVNPVSVFVSAYHGQFDAIAALCILLALYWLARSSLASGAWLGLGILVKSWPILALPSMLAGIQTRKQKILFLTVVGLIPMIGIGLYIILFDASPQAVLGRALGYNRGVGVWGYTYLARLSANIQPGLSGLFNYLVLYGRYFTLAALGLIWWLKARKQEPLAGILTVLVAFLAITHAFAIQYLVWVIPFAILCQDNRWLRRYSLAAFIYMFLAYNTLILEWHITNLLPWPQADLYLIIPASLPVWLVTIGWTIERIIPKNDPSSTDPPSVQFEKTRAT